MGFFKIKKLDEGVWRLASYRATVIGTIIGLVSLYIIIISLQFTLVQVQSSIDTTEKLIELVESNKNQTRALEETIKEIQHQTIVDAYANGGTFNVKFERCSFSSHFDPEGNFIGTMLNIKPIMINEKNAQTIVPFYIFIDYEFSGYDAKQEKYQRFFKLGTDTFVYDIGHESLSQQVDIQQRLDQAKDAGYSDIKITADYAFRPFSPVKNISLGDQSESTEQDFAVLKLMENGWHVQDFREKYPCR